MVTSRDLKYESWSVILWIPATPSRYNLPSGGSAVIQRCHREIVWQLREEAF